ncbi:MAG: hypothetical protein K0R17_4003 [Rariglobus sp.]|jgi:hypothetical protein|nr:hypothetical protein [Rariglobus sp.]
MSERLRHLQRQQALLREHLAWIDAEIAREAASAPVPMPAAQPPGTSPPTPIPGSAPAPDTANNTTPPAAASADEADVLIQHYARGERQNPADLRRGCLLVFSSALLLLAAGIAAVWLIYY